MLPLNADALLSVTVGGLPPVLTGFTGLLDGDGIGAGQANFAGLGALIGFRFFAAFIVLDGSAPSGIRTISNPVEVLVQ